MEINIGTGQINLNTGREMKLSAALTPYNATEQALVWSSTDRTVADISADGLLKAYKTGPVTITAESKNNSAIKASRAVSVQWGDAYTENFENADTALIQGLWANTTLTVFDDGGNKAVKNSTTTGNAFFGPVTWKDYSLELDYKLADDADNTSIIGRYSGTVRYQLSARSGQRLTLNKYNNGTNTAVATAGSGLGKNVWRRIKLVFKGNIVEVYVDGVRQIYYEDSAPFTEGRAGIVGWNTLSVDNIKILPVYGDAVQAEGIALNENSTVISVGGRERLYANIIPANAANKAVNWSSDNPESVTVNDGGEITAVSEGTAIITAVTEDGGYTAECAVSAAPGAPSNVVIESAKAEVDFNNARAAISGVTAKSGKQLEISASKPNDAAAFYTETVMAEDNNGKGSFSVAFALPQNPPSGTYTAYIRGKNAEEITAVPFVYYTAEVERGIIAEFNNAVGADEIGDILAARFGELSLPEASENVCSALLNRNFTNIASVRGAYYAASAIEKLNAADVNSAPALFPDILEKLGISEKSAELYEKLNNKNGLYGFITGKGYSLRDVGAALKQFDDGMALAAVNGAGAVERENIRGILIDYGDILDIDISKLPPAGSENMLALAKALTGKGFTTADAVRTAYNGTVNGFVTPPSAGSVTSGGGTPGGGGNTMVLPLPVPPKQPLPTEKPPIFSDVANWHWGKESIEALADSGVIAGIGGGLFDPDGYVTREQFVKMAVMAFGLLDESAEARFGDVNESAWFYPYVASAVKSGAVKGYGGNIFGTGEKISRQDMAALLYRISGMKGKTLPKINEPAAFGDAGDIADYAREAIGAMASAGVLNGTGGGKMEPKGYATRAMAAKVIYLLMSVTEVTV
jgi:hypothetical protein